MPLLRGSIQVLWCGMLTEPCNAEEESDGDTDHVNTTTSLFKQASIEKELLEDVPLLTDVLAESNKVGIMTN